MYSKAKIAGHPIHPMLVAFPVAFYTSTLVAFIVYGANGDPFWFRLGFIANVAGVVMALVAAIPGFIDWATGIPNNSKAKGVGLTHMLLNVTALAVFIVSAFVASRQLNNAVPDSTAGTVLAAIGVGLTVAAGFFGWALVQTYHVGVDLSPEQRRQEPSAAPPFERRHPAH